MKQLKFEVERQIVVNSENKATIHKEEKTILNLWKTQDSWIELGKQQWQETFNNGSFRKKTRKWVSSY